MGQMCVFGQKVLGAMGWCLGFEELEVGLF
jgi:hypothetical protein